jgi:hypothetical protein
MRREVKGVPQFITALTTQESPLRESYFGVFWVLTISGIILLLRVTCSTRLTMKEMIKLPQRSARFFNFYNLIETTALGAPTKTRLAWTRRVTAHSTKAAPVQLHTTEIVIQQHWNVGEDTQRGVNTWKYCHCAKWTAETDFSDTLASSIGIYIRVELWRGTTK